MEQEPAYQDVAVPDVLSPWDGPLHYTSLQDPVQQQPKQQQQGNSGKGFICIWLDAFCLFLEANTNTDSSSPFAMDPGLVLFPMPAYKIMHATTTQEATIGKFWQRIHGHL
jgi:hypothetical protein